MVADLHRTLLYGGIFCYPASRTRPQGKLRLLLEAVPMAYLFEQAGGAASSGVASAAAPLGDKYGRSILELTPTSSQQCTPVYLGSAEDVRDAICSIGSPPGQVYSRGKAHYRVLKQFHVVEGKGWAEEERDGTGLGFGWSQHKPSASVSPRESPAPSRQSTRSR